MMWEKYDTISKIKYHGMDHKKGENPQTKNFLQEIWFLTKICQQFLSEEFHEKFPKRYSHVIEHDAELFIIWRIKSSQNENTKK